MPIFTGHLRLSFISMDAVPTARVMGLARGLDAKIYRTLETLFILMDVGTNKGSFQNWGLFRA
jgi:hypothetical protein